MDTNIIRQYAQVLCDMDLTALEVRADGSVRLERSCFPGTAPAPAPVVQEFRESHNSHEVHTDVSETENTLTESADDSNTTVITSPMVGMFYAAPAENAEPFVQVGSTVHKGDVICIIEAMKLMNEITAETDGTITEILIVNGAVVEFGQPMFRLRKD